MLNHFAVALGAPPSDSASRVIPITATKTRKTLENRTYSPIDLPNIFIDFSSMFESNGGTRHRQVRRIVLSQGVVFSLSCK
jgi:hypothetical protein